MPLLNTGKIKLLLPRRPPPLRQRRVDDDLASCPCPALDRRLSLWFWCGADSTPSAAALHHVIGTCGPGVKQTNKTTLPPGVRTTTTVGAVPRESIHRKCDGRNTRPPRSLVLSFLLFTSSVDALLSLFCLRVFFFKKRNRGAKKRIKKLYSEFLIEASKC